MKYKRFLSILLALVMVLTLLPVLTPPAKAAGSVTINDTNFEDVKFQTYLKTYKDSNGDGVLSADEIAEATRISVYGEGISSLKGIEYFTALIELYCGGNEITSLDLSKNTALENLRCYNNKKLTKLNVSGHSALKELDVSNNTAMTSLTCRDCALTWICLDGCTALTYLDCENNQLKKLEVGDCTALKTLDFSGNQLTSLDVSNNEAITFLDADYNHLKELDVANNLELTSLYCTGNQLTYLDVSYHDNLWRLWASENTALTDLNCRYCALTDLKVSGCAALESLDCEENELESLDVSGCTALESLNCKYNKLTELNVNGMETLGNLECIGNPLETLYCYDTGIVYGLDVSNITTLKDLRCHRCKISLLDVSGCTALETLICFENRLTSLNLKDNTALKYLDVEDNQLTALDLSKQPALETLYCKGNKLTSLDVKKHSNLKVLGVKDNPELTNLECYECALTYLTVSGCTALEKLSCYDNQLQTLDLEDCSALKELYVYENQLNSLDVSHNGSLLILDCSGTDITALDISACAALSDMYLTSAPQTHTYHGYQYYSYSNDDGFLSVPLSTVVTAAAPPAITTQPENQSVTAGVTALFKVAATGTGITYQWQFSTDNGGAWKNISGATADSYSITPTESDNGTLYRCIVKNTGGSVTSGSAKLTVTAPPTSAKPTIKTQPAAQTADAGQTVTFKVEASGTGLSYQWQSSTDNGGAWTNISGATAASYTLTTKEADNGTLFRCVVKNEGGSVTSNSAKLTVNAAAAAAPTISSIKAGVTSAKTGETITWTAKASGGTGTLKYYFILYKDGTKVKTQAYSTKNTFSYAPKGAGTFKVKVYVKDAADAKVNKTSTGVTVTSAAPTISSVKAGISSAYAGETITWTATASGGTGTLKYYFILYKDGKKIKTRSYSTARTFSYTPAEAGSYKVKVYVKDSTGAKSYKTSGKIAVTLGPPAILSVKAGKTSSAVGEKITWTAKAVGSEQPLKYYFVLYKNGKKIKTQAYSTKSTFSYTPKGAGTYKVKVYVKDATGEKVYKTSAKIKVS